MRMMILKFWKNRDLSGVRGLQGGNGQGPLEEVEAGEECWMGPSPSSLPFPFRHLQPPEASLGLLGF